MRVGEGTGPDGTPAIIFNLVAVGLPKDKVYQVWVQPSAQDAPTQLPYEFSIGDGGYVVQKGSSAPFSFGLYGFARGEAEVLALMTADKSYIAFGKTVIYPIEAKQGSSRIWVELRSPTGTIFIIYGEGFEPGEELEATSTFDGEVMRGIRQEVDGNGRFMLIYLPAVLGRQSGLVTYAVVGKGGPLTVSFEWGPPALRPGP